MLDKKSPHYAQEVRHQEIDDPDFRQRRARMLAKVVDRIDDNGSTTESRVHALLSGSGNAFIGTLVGANRILTQTHRDEHGTGYMIPFNNVILDPENPGYSHVLPHHEDKHNLLLHLHRVAADMWKRDRSAEHIAAVIGYGINLVHPFTEANGRTARMIHDTLIHGTTGTEARFPSLALDSIDNTDSLNPEIIESYVYQQMQLRYGTHKLEGDTNVPNIQFAMSPPTMQKLFARTSSEVRSLVSPFDHTVSTISHPETSAMLAHFIARDCNTLPVKSSIGHYSGQAVLNLDRFSELASDDDWSDIHKCARQISATYAIDAIHVLAAHPAYGPELSVTSNTHERGAITLPISQLIQELAQQKIHRKAW